MGAKANTATLNQMTEHLKQQVGDKVYAQITPEVQAAIDEMIALCTVIFNAIKQDFADTQLLITQDVQRLELLTTSAVANFGNAKSLDTALNSCRLNEMYKLAAWETCNRDLAACEKSKCEKCELKAKRWYNYALDENLRGSKNCAFDINMVPYIANSSDCPAFRSLASAYVEVVQGWHTHKAAYDYTHTECTSQAEECDLKRDACEDLWDDFQTHKQSCDADCGATKTSICSFGNRYQEKCVALHKYNTLMVDVVKTGGDVLSEPDRQAEWDAVQTIKCLLEAYVEGGTFNDQGQEFQDCPELYVDGVGSLDKGESNVTTLTTDANFNCEESSVQFSGKKWSYTQTYVQVNGNTCEGAGYEVITTEEECQAGAKAMCLQYGGDGSGGECAGKTVQIKSNAAASKPCGCTWHPNSGNSITGLFQNTATNEQDWHRVNIELWGDNCAADFTSHGVGGYNGICKRPTVTSASYQSLVKHYNFALQVGTDPTLDLWMALEGFPNECDAPPKEELCPLVMPKYPALCPGTDTTTVVQWENWAKQGIIPDPKPEECTCQPPPHM